ncbi:MAG: hypothetical protein Q4G04_03610 [bacterium]|nr:hypothetical protein [bacterium]
MKKTKSRYVKNRYIRLKKNRLAILSLILLSGFLLIPVLTTFSRYVIRSASEHYYNSKEFYFSSDFLNNNTYDLYNWDGISNYQLLIDITNAKDSLNWTKYNIEYEIDAVCSSPGKAISCTASNENILNFNDSLLTTNTNTITINRGTTIFTPGDTVTLQVTARSIAPYEKDISSTFIIHVNSAKVSYTIEDEIDSYYATLIISNSDITKDITINFDASALNIDETNYYVQNGTTTTTNINGVETINSLTMEVENSNVYSIRFYKNDPAIDYTLNNTVLTLS